MDLSIEQIEAVTTQEKKVLIAAGPGAGKTAVLIERIKYLLSTKDVAKNIYAITFTRNAAAEMRERLSDFGDYVFIGTIHSLAHKILTDNRIEVVIDEEEEDFDRLFDIIKGNPFLEIPKIDYLLVDEFQDTTNKDCDFIFNILKPKSYFIVGDSCQSIYSFRGSNYQNFMNLLESPYVEVYTLSNDYRNGINILKYAQTKLKGVKNIYKIPLKCTREYDGIVKEESFSYKTLLENIRERGELKEWFVLTRTNKELSNVISFLKRHNIPCLTFKQSEKNYEELKQELNKDFVKVLTIHSSKGLEAKYVAVLGARDWNDEEKRLQYVAATRAKNFLLVLQDKKEPYKKKRTSLPKMSVWDMPSGDTDKWIED